MLRVETSLPHTCICCRWAGGGAGAAVLLYGALLVVFVHPRTAQLLCFCLLCGTHAVAHVVESTVNPA